MKETWTRLFSRWLSGVRNTLQSERKSGFFNAGLFQIFPKRKRASCPALLNALETAQVVVVELDDSLRVIGMNEAAEVAMGISWDEAKGKFCKDLFDVSSHQLQIHLNKPEARELMIRTANGGSTPFLATFKRYEALGERMRYMMVAHNLSGVKAQLEVLRTQLTETEHLYSQQTTELLRFQKHTEDWRRKGQFFSFLLEQAEMAVAVYDLTGQIQWGNRHFEQLTGYTLTEITDLNIRKLFPDQLILDNHNENPAEGFQTTFRYVSMRHKDHSITPTEIRLSAGFLNGEKLMVGVFRDMSGEKEREEQYSDKIERFREKERKLKRFMEDKAVQVETTSTVVAEPTGTAVDITFSPEGNVLSVGQTFADIFGYRPGCERSLTHSDLLDPKFTASPAYTAFWQGILYGRVAPSNFEMRNASGEKIFLRGEYKTELQNGKCQSVTFSGRVGDKGHVKATTVTGGKDVMDQVRKIVFDEHRKVNKNIHILIVEDEPLIALQIHEILDSEGFHHVYECNSGEKAVLMADKTRFDLILMDIKLKGNITGLQAAMQIKDKRPLPIVFISAFVDTIEQREKELLGMNTYYLTKPISRADLLDFVELASIN